MADKRISDLSGASTLTLADLLVLVNESQTRNTTIGDLLELIANQNQFAELDEEGKIPAELLPDTVFGAVTYQASWNANTNTPALPTAAPENKGWYYVVGTDGATNVNGITDWKIGDWVVSNGSTWQKVDNTDAVSSWNGRAGAVVPASGDYTTSLVTEGSNKYYTRDRVFAEALTELLVQNSAILNTDTIMEAIGKAQGQIDNRATLVGGKIPTSQLPDAVLGSANYQGAWDASNNTPTLPTAAAGNKGWYYVVSNPGNSNAGGITEWKIGDWVISNGTTWQKVDNTDAISSWNGRIGAVVPVSGDYTTNTVPESGTTNLYYTGPRVRAETLSGFVASDGSLAIASGDSILTAFNKAQGQINNRATLVSGKIPTSQLPDAILGSANYQGSWNASTNSPAIPTAATANKGWYYVVSTAGSTNIGGITDWKVGDWVISNGSAWQKVDNTDAISSWNGRTGAVVPVSGDYTTLTVTEAGSNLYYTGARVRAEVLTGLAPISGTIAATDSILTAFNKTQGQLSAKENSANKGVAGGYASLDTNTRLPKAQLTRGTNSIDLDFTGGVASTTETIKYTIQIPAGVFAAGDQLEIEAWIGASGTTKTKTINAYISTGTGFAVGATQIGSYTLTAGTVGSFKFERQLSFITNTTVKCGVAGTTSSPNGENSSTMDAAITIPDITAAFYVHLTIFKAPLSTDTFRLERVALKGIYA